MTLTPAYGRDYKSAQAVLDDWSADKDFIESLSGKPVNKADLSVYEGNITIRYHKLTRSIMIGE